MGMTDDQLRRLAEADESTVTMCYHGINVTAMRVQNFPTLYRIRLIGHLINGMEDVDSPGEEVPEHREFSIDIPVTQDGAHGIVSIMLNTMEDSAEKDRQQEAQIKSDWMRVRDIPDFLESIFRRMPRHDDDDHDGGESV